MTISPNIYKFAALALVVSLLTNCVSAPTHEAISVQGSRVEDEASRKAQKEAQALQKLSAKIEQSKRELVALAPPSEAEAPNAAPNEAALLSSETLKQLISQLEKGNALLAASLQDPELDYNQAQYKNVFTAKDKEALFRLISSHPEAVGQIFKRYRVNPTIQSQYNPVSTFAMDVDNGSYKLAAAMLRQHAMPNPEGIRVEEFVNAFDYQYAVNENSHELFSLSAEAMPSPLRKGFHLLHVGAQTKKLLAQQRNPSNIVLVLDVSGSMDSDNKMDLLKTAMKILVSQLGRDDQLAIVAYNNEASVLLKSTPVTKKRYIYKKIDSLDAGGGTNVEAALLSAYKLANEMYQPGFNNRVILTSDGVTNTGARSPEAILRAINTAQQKGIFLTTLGVGVGVYNDHLLEQLANQGNGTYLYVANQDDIQETFVDKISSQLQTVAKDAKIQITFDPSRVSHYRLLGYENRHLEQQDFLDADKDGAEIGAGQKVTAIYEIKLNDSQSNNNKPIADVAIAYKKPEGRKVFQLQKTIPASVIKDSAKNSSADSILSYSAAAFAEKLRQSYWSRFYHYQDIQTLLNELPLVYKNVSQVRELEALITQAARLSDVVDPFEHSHPLANVSLERVPLLD